MSADELQKQLGARVSSFRRARGLSQDGLAAKIETTTETVSNIERGVTWPRPSTLVSIAEALEITTSQLLGDPLPPKPEHPLIQQIVALLSERNSAELQAVLDQTRILLQIASQKN